MVHLLKYISGSLFLEYCEKLSLLITIIISITIVNLIY